MNWLALAEQCVDGYFATIPRRKPYAIAIEKARLIAHRGAHDNAQGIFENTHAAFKLAQQCGCWGLELDIHATADGVLVVNHDATLERLWQHKVAIAALSFNELRVLEPRVPSLTEVINAYPEMHLFIELKAPFTAEEALVGALAGLIPGQDYHLLSLEVETFEHLNCFPPQALLLVAMHDNIRQFCRLSLTHHYGGVMGSYLLMADKLRQQLTSASQMVGVGFVNSKNSLYRELNRDISWLFTNKAVLVSRYLKELQQAVEQKI